ncbi:MAG TPA: hypothetical protein VFJ14_17160 [Nocardioidaceae bacterium]|nr:hypothetical protein [Nocardioidaceae bacterium]
MASSDSFRTALVAEAMKKTGICWVRWAGDARDHPVWHLWRDGAAYVVAGPGEQPLPGAETAESATVIARTKDSRARLIVWEAAVSRLLPGSPEWEEVVGLLQADRLNLADPDQVAQRWAAECSIVRLSPTGATGEGPGAYSTDDLSAAPLPTGATTRGRLPRVLHRRQTRRPRLR